MFFGGGLAIFCTYVWILVCMITSAANRDIINKVKRDAELRL